MTAALGIAIGVIVVAALVISALMTFRRRQEALAARQAERERTGEADELRRRHAEREARARASDDR